MSDSETFEAAMSLALQLTPVHKARLMERLAATLEQDLAAREQAPLPSLYGALSDLGTAPVADTIDEARREARSNFPRQDNLCPKCGRAGSWT